MFFSVSLIYFSKTRSQNLYNFFDVSFKLPASTTSFILSRGCRRMLVSCYVRSDWFGFTTLIFAAVMWFCVCAIENGLNYLCSTPRSKKPSYHKL